MRVISAQLAFSAIALLGGCTASDASLPGIEVTETDSAGVALVTIRADAADLPALRLSDTPITEISGNVAPFFTDVGEVVFLTDGGLLVEDNRSAELHVFDASGGIVRTIGRAGDGPGEFRNITALGVGPGDTAYAYDRRLARMTVLDPAGELAEIVSVGRELAGEGSIALDAWLLGPGGFLVHSMGPVDRSDAVAGPRLEQREAVLTQLDPRDQAGARSLRFRGGLTTVGQRFDGASPFANETPVAVGPDRVVRSSGVEYELTISSAALEAERVVRWLGWREPLDELRVAAVRDSVAMRFEEMRRIRPERVTALLEAMFAPSLLPEELPALGTVLLDDGLRMWVSRFRPSTEQWHQADAWHVLAASGRPIARVSLPRDTKLVAVHGNEVALVMRDELEVQHVRVFEIVEWPRQGGS